MSLMVEFVKQGGWGVVSKTNDVGQEGGSKSQFLLGLSLMDDPLFGYSNLKSIVIFRLIVLAVDLVGKFENKIQS